MIRFDEDQEQRAQEITDRCREMLHVAEFIQEGLTHGTIAEATYTAMKELQEGRTIDEALKTGRQEWFK